MIDEIKAELGNLDGDRERAEEQFSNARNAFNEFAKQKTVLEAERIA